MGVNEIEHIRRELETLKEENRRNREALEELASSHEQLRERESRFRSIINNTDAGYFFADKEGILRFVNNAWVRMHRHASAEEVIGRRFIDLQMPDYRKQAARLVDEIIRGEKSVFKGYFVCRDQEGEAAHHRYTANPVKKDGTVIGFEGFVFDITEMVQTETALRESEERFRNLIESTNDWIWELDMDGRFTYASPHVKQILGYTPDEIVGKIFVDIIDPSYREGLLRGLEERKKSQTPFTVFDTAHIHKDGRKIFIQTSGAPFFNDMGEMVGIRGINRDITEKKKIQDESAELQNKLMRYKKMEALGLMAGGVAHDLNNILSGITSYPELLLMSLADDSPLRKPLETIRASGLRAAAVVDDLLTIARGVTISREPMNLNRTVQDYLRSPEYQKMAGQYESITIQTRFDDELLPIKGSPLHINKALMNLVSNAFEAIQENGTIRISTRNAYMDQPRMGYEPIPAGEYAVLGVSDSGRGIAGTDLEHIFEPFYSKKVMGRSGTGLGLAVVWNTVKDNHGFIDVNSSPTGSVIDLYFPVTREAIDAQIDQQRIAVVYGCGERILIVDDEENQRELLRDLLEELRYRPHAVRGGIDALKYLRTNKADLVILDMIMPGMNGCETYAEILKIHPGQKAIIASGYSETEDVLIAQNLGAGSYVKKPYTIKKIGVAIRTELDAER